MNFNHPDKGGSTIVVKTMCAIVFIAFSILWLYAFQSDVLAVAQHVLSEGHTRYDRLVGALLITAVLYMLQLLAYYFTRLRKMFHALTYLPSMLVLALISDINSDIDRHFSLGAWWWVVPVVLLFWVALVIVARQIQTYERGAGNFFSRRMWVNMLVMATMIVCVAAVGNTNAVFHFRAHAEVKLRDGLYEEALAVGNRSQESDASLMMLRIYALSRSGRLGEHLFNYPIVGGSDAMLPFGNPSRTVLFPADSIFRYLGAIPKGQMTTRSYLSLLENKGKASPAVGDYMLAACLIDGDLDTFVRLLPKYYELDGKLPRHYREALTLYTHQRATPAVTWHDNVMEEDYADLQKLEATCPDATERKVRVAEKYEGSYWYYFEYVKAMKFKE